MISPFNDEQAQAIETRGVSILVSAPAGSGKTKILVSRIMSLLMEEFYHVDEFLVLTFTQAAAAEMKQRLLFAIEDELKKDLEPAVYAHLVKQKEKIPYAYITNFHGFCSQLLKKYGYLVEIEPGFDILSETKMLKHEVLDSCIEQWSQESTFTDFISLYFNDMRFDGLKAIILELYEMIHSMDDVPRFVQFIKEHIYEDYMDNNQDLTTWKIFPEIKRQLENGAILGYNNLVELTDFAIEKGIHDFSERPSEQTKTNATLPIPFEIMEAYFTERFTLLKQDYLAYEQFKQVSLRSLEKAYTMKWDEDIKPYQKEFNSKKNNVIKPYLDKAKTYLPEDELAFKMILKESYYVIEMLLGEKGLVYRFKEDYQIAKQQQHVLDFNDLEQSTIALLQPTRHISEVLYHQLKEIMIDEYQDTNQIQETIINLIKDYQNPSIITFRVGDMKQSIYRFRQADPQLFKEKYDRYSLSAEEAINSGNLRIDLRYNYRSNKIVLDSVNYIFNQIMDSKVGGLEYLHDASSHLNYDYLRKEKGTLEDLPETIKKTTQRYQNESRFDSEVLLFDDSQLGDLKASEYEAHLVVLKILELVKQGSVDGYDGQPRKINYRDIVVLMRSTSLFLTFKKVFDQYHIPNHIVLSQGYLNAVEIISVMTVLKALINRYDDVSMLSLLRGNYTFSHFEENTIITLRLLGKDKPLIDNINQYINEGLDKDERLTRFIEQYNQLHQDMLHLSPSLFLKTLLDISGYRLFVGQLINGSQRVANLDLLVEEFEALESQSDLFAIVDYYEEKMKKQSASSPAQMITSSDDVVQFMTIHKSKGLEFPIVFVSNIDKGFNKQDSTKRILLDKQLGIAVKPRTKKTIDLLEGQFIDQIVEYENPYRRLLAAKQTEEAINEEMRIFYVALTRASQKLILTGVSNMKQMLDWQRKVLLNENPDIMDGQINQHILLYYNARKANSYLDWVGLSLMRHPLVIKQWQAIILPEEWQILKNNMVKIEALPSTKQYCFDNTKDAKFTLSFYTSEQLDKKMEAQIPKVSHHNKQASLTFITLPPASTVTISTSATKMQKEEDQHDYGYTPVIKTDKALTPSEKGTLVHAFFEYLPLTNTNVLATIDSLYQKGLYNELEKSVLESYQDKIEAFIKSDCFSRMKTAKALYKEKSFSLLDEETNQIVHGIFDVLCIEENRVTIIDYKTDRVKVDTDDYYLKENHRVQMEYYKLLLSRLYPQHKIEAMMYYLEIGKYILL